MKLFFKTHIIPFLFAFGICSGLLFAFIYLFPVSSQEDSRTITGKQQAFRGAQANFQAGTQAEIEFLASIRNRDYLTLMGSSEFSNLPYSSYYFLPDSLNIPVMGFGHAYHQSFSIACELMAAQKDLKGAKVCIFVSPTWFIVDGTNIEAFLEFVPQNFLVNIAKNDSIPVDFKLKIASFIHKNIEHVSCTNGILNYYDNLHKTKHVKPLFDAAYKLRNTFQGVNYEITLNQNFKTQNPVYDRKNLDLQVKERFLSSIKTNDIYVNDTYFKDFIYDEKVKKPNYFYSTDFFFSDQELHDFELLIEVLKLYKVDASFIIQPMNPHYYTGLENFEPNLNRVRQLIRQNNYPCYDMFSAKKSDFEPGTLNDVMHLGDYGWTKISKFLVDTYYKKDAKKAIQ